MVTYLRSNESAHLVMPAVSEVAVIVNWNRSLDYRTASECGPGCHCRCLVKLARRYSAHWPVRANVVVGVCNLQDTFPLGAARRAVAVSLWPPGRPARQSETPPAPRLVCRRWFTTAWYWYRCYFFSGPQSPVLAPQSSARQGRQISAEFIVYSVLWLCWLLAADCWQCRVPAARDAGTRNESSFTSLVGVSVSAVSDLPSELIRVSCRSRNRRTDARSRFCVLFTPYLYLYLYRCPSVLCLLFLFSCDFAFRSPNRVACVITSRQFCSLSVCGP